MAAAAERPGVIEFGAPAFLAIGTALALGPLLLHFFAPRPPDPAPLPTARFLEPDARLRPRLQRRPRDVALMVLRMLALLLAAAALAAPSWVRRASGTETFVLFDTQAVDSATLRRLGGGAARAIGFTDYVQALRALRAAAAGSAYDSVRGRLISDFASARWSPGLGAARAALWPATLRVERVAGPPERTPEPLRVAALPSDHANPIAAATRALGGEVVAAAAADVVFVLDSTARAVSVAGVVVFAGVAPPALRQLNRTPTGATGGALVLADGLVLHDVAPAGPAPDPALGEVIAVWESGAPAAVATRDGARCVIHLQASLSGGAPIEDARFPTLIESLARCGERAPVPITGLDALLRGTHTADAVAVRGLGGPRGVPVARWFIAAALAALLAESLLRRRPA